MKKITFILLSFLSLGLFAQNQSNPVSWSATYVDKGNKQGEILIKALIEDKWHIYSQRPTDAGPIPTSFSITPQEGVYVLNGKVEEKDAHEEYVKAFEAKIFVFDHEAVFTQKITRQTNKAFTVNIKLEYMTCNDMQCLPPKIIDLQVNVPAIVSKSKL